MEKFVRWRADLILRLSLSSISSSIRLGLAVAVRTEHSQVFKAMIIANAIQVIALNSYYLSSPLTYTAFVAGVLQVPSLQKFPFNRVSAS
jgi:hypothetical protein